MLRPPPNFPPSPPPPLPLPSPLLLDPFGAKCYIVLHCAVLVWLLRLIWRLLNILTAKHCYCTCPTPPHSIC
eukprot:5543-Eustigmatos_ZCMA.PRE.1